MIQPHALTASGRYPSDGDSVHDAVAVVYRVPKRLFMNYRSWCARASEICKRRRACRRGCGPLFRAVLHHTSTLTQLD